MIRTRRRALVIAARQPHFAELLEQAGFEVEVRTRPVDGHLGSEPDVAVVFRGRLIGRAQAARFSERGVPVVEVMTVAPPGHSTAGWLRLSNRINRADLVQIVEAIADSSGGNGGRASWPAIASGGDARRRSA